MGISH